MISRAARRYLVLAAILLAAEAHSQDRLRVVATIPDLADIARQVGGDRVEVESIAVGVQDPHYVDPKPSFVVKLNRADAFIQVGLDLEIGWAPTLLNQSRNSRIQRGGEGHVDASEVVEILERPTGPVSRAEGDIHVFGNPHYWLDPVNGKRIAAQVAGVFAKLRPAWAAEFEAGRARFDERIDGALVIWLSRLKPFEGRAVVAYHNSWPYFTRRFGIRVAGFIEPKPGIPPSPRDLVRAIDLVRSQRIHAIVHTVYYDDKPSRFLAEKTGARLITLVTSVGGAPEVEDYFDLFDYNVGLLAAAMSETE
jgi:zinc/manganese transport system substrate-binding protein